MGLAFVLYLFDPISVEAKVLKLNDQTWEINPEFSNPVTTPLIHSTHADLRVIAGNSMFGKPISIFVRPLNTETVDALRVIELEVTKQKSEAKLVIENNRAKEFDPGSIGQNLDMFKTASFLNSPTNEFSLPVLTVMPQTTLADTNTLGIKELIAVGESDFTGSPRNRIHNVIVGAEKFNGLIIAQGEEFSFNKYLGEVDGENGFLPELVIKRTGVVPEFGGGLCQVSSTSFRAAMNAGFPITARRNHSFAVQYYAPQGTDATIYPGSQDFKFLNDSSGPILIRTKIVGQKLYFEYYGTKDDRGVAFDGPVQFDKKSDGSMKATWTRHVTKNGEVTTQTFNSTYLPPALFHPEEQANTPNPEATPTPTPTPTPATT